MLSLKIERSIKTVCYHFISILGFPTLEALIIRMATGAGALRILDRHVLKSMISSFQLLQLELDQRPASSLPQGSRPLALGIGTKSAQGPKMDAQ